MDMAMNDRVYASGEWHDRASNWRDEINLGECDSMTAYAAGRDDGYRQAVTEFRALWLLLLRLDSSWDTTDVAAVIDARRAAVPAPVVPGQRHLRVVRS